MSLGNREKQLRDERWGCSLEKSQTKGEKGKKRSDEGRDSRAT